MGWVLAGMETFNFGILSDISSGILFNFFLEL